MREFAEMRPDIMRQHFVDSMELPGTAQITFDQTSEDGGWIVVNGSAPQQLPWQGEYFQNTTIRLQAIPPVGQMFDSWATVPELELDQSETITITVEGLMSITPKFIPLADAALRPDDVAFVNVWPNDKSEIEGDWFELQVNRDGGINFGGWRITDNDSLGADDEGSLIFLEDPLIADLPKGTIVRVIATQSVNNSLRFPEDGWQDGMLLLYAGNGRIDSTSDPWFNLGRSDNLVILAPGNTSERADDVPVGFWSNNLEVTPSSFGLPPNNLGGFQP